jgi:SAM-dependent methyltransferase
VSRPLYTSFAWAYDLVIAVPGGPPPAEVARLLAGRRRVVDVGCGTGRHSAALAKAGFHVTGIDASPAMLEVARSRAPDVDFELADLRTWQPEEPFDGALCRGVLNDLVDDGDRQAGLDSLAGMLRPGGLLVLDVWERERVHRRFKHEPIVTRSAEGVFFRSETRFVGDVMVVDETISSENDHELFEFRMRAWTLSELDERLAAAGFGKVERRLEGDRIVAACFL